MYFIQVSVLKTGQGAKAMVSAPPALLLVFPPQAESKQTKAAKRMYLIIKNV
jgi:hypothetical protein